MQLKSALIFQVSRLSLQKVKVNKEKTTGRGGMREEEAAVHILIKTKIEEEEIKKDNTEMRADTGNIDMTETDTEMVMVGGTVIMIREDINTKFSTIIIKPINNW